MRYKRRTTESLVRDLKRIEQSEPETKAAVDEMIRLIYEVPEVELLGPKIYRTTAVDNGSRRFVCEISLVLRRADIIVQLDTRYGKTSIITGSNNTSGVISTPDLLEKIKRVLY